MAKKPQVNKAYVEKFVAEHGFPEVGHFEDSKDLQKFYKHLSIEQLVDWVALEGLQDTVKPTDSEPIYRMRLAMAILYKHYPKAPSAKKKSKYADYTNEQLLQLAIDNDVVFEMCDDERILRMRAIMALRVKNIIQ
jgi:hypothetical protein